MVPLFSRFFRFALLTSIAVLLTTSAPAHAQTATRCKLMVKVTGIRNTKGNIRVTLRSGPETVVQRQVVEIDPKTMTAQVAFLDVQPGTYDVAVIHDENKNGTLDFNEMGMPTEGYGHSNNPPRRPGPPDFSESKFTLGPAGAAIEINLIYW